MRRRSWSRRRSGQGWPTVAGAAGIAALAALAFASFVQQDLGIVPCELCLIERWPYRIAAALAVIGMVLPSRFGRLAVSLILLDLLVSVALAVFHVGVEWHAWPSPFPECNAPAFSGGSIADQLAHMPDHPAKPCDAATFLVPGLPLSMAALNGIYALAVFLVVTRLAARRGV